jgi:hypothetical protein
VLSAARETLATSLDPQELARRSYDPLGLTQLPIASAGATGFRHRHGPFRQRRRHLPPRVRRTGA